MSIHSQSTSFIHLSNDNFLVLGQANDFDLDG